MTQIGILELGRATAKLVQDYGDFPQMFRTYFTGQPGMEFITFSVFEGTPVPPPDACDAWIMTGSPASVYEKQHPWIAPMMDFIRVAHELSIPNLGICFGHQIMAQALGGNVVRSEKGRGIGVHHYDLTEAGQKIFPSRHGFNLIATHQDQVVVPPPGAVLLAKSDFCSYAALAYGKSGLTIQAHPEFTPAFERDLIVDWQKLSPAPDKVVAAAMDSLDRIQPDAPALMPVLRDFLLRRAP